jgi:hypothetical protein
MRVDLVQQVARLAGVSNVVTMTEPVAAAYCYAQQGSFATGDTVAVYDLGGGTFDATLVRWTSSSFEVVGEPFGIEHLGGLDLDEAVVAHVVGALSPALDDLDPDDAGAAAMMAALRHEAVLAKEALSADTEADVNIVLADGPHSVRINRSELETLVRPALARTVEVLERAIGSAGLAPGDLSAILLSGGASRTPLISQLIGQRMTTPVITYAHPKYVVALGAAASTSTDRSLPPSPRPAAAAAAVVATAPNATTPPAAPPPPEPPTAAPEPAPPAPPADTPTALEPSEPERRKPRRRLVLLGVLAVLAIAAVAAFLVANRSDKQGVAATSTATQLVLEPASSVAATSPGCTARCAGRRPVAPRSSPPRSRRTRPPRPHSPARRT